MPDVIELYPNLDSALRSAGVANNALNDALVSGERFHERVFRGALVDLGEDVDAEFDLTLWYAAKSSKPVIAELSFKYDTQDGELTSAVAWRALLLFRALQEMPGGWASAAGETKTKMALPKKCQD